MCTHIWRFSPKLEKWQEVLTDAFGIRWRETDNPRSPYEPIWDENGRRYLLELDDATKLLHGRDDRPVNFSDIPDDVAIQTREYVDSDQTDRILDMPE